MSELAGRRLMVTCFFLTCAIITWTDIHKFGQVPRPQRYVSASVVYGMLGIGATFLTWPFTSLLGVGVVLSLLYSYYDKNFIGNTVWPTQIPDNADRVAEPQQTKETGA